MRSESTTSHEVTSTNKPRLSKKRPASLSDFDFGSIVEDWGTNGADTLNNSVKFATHIKSIHEA